MKMKCIAAALILFVLMGTMILSAFPENIAFAPGDQSHSRA